MMTTDESGGENAEPQAAPAPPHSSEQGGTAAQPAPPRKGRGGLIALIVVILVVLGGGAAGYYYLLYLPSTPRAVLTEYLALDEKGDYDGTYRFLSEKSRKFFPLSDWKIVYDQRAPWVAQLATEYTVGEPTFTDGKCHIEVASTTRPRDPKRELPPGIRASGSDTVLMVKEKAGWKVGLYEQIIEKNVESMRERGLSQKQIEQVIEDMNKELEQRAAEAGP